MRRNFLGDKAGASAVETIIVLIILIAFAVFAIIIIFHSFIASLPGLGKTTPTSGNSPLPCQISAANLSCNTQSCYYQVNASEGSPGLTYSLYNNSGKIGSYEAGLKGLSFTELVTGTERYVCNTTGGSSYGPGGEFQVILTK
jgi:hypothetical protein